jgi:hypothetical protein
MGLAAYILKWKGMGAYAAAAAVTVLAAGCIGETTLSAVEQTEGYDVRMNMDPPTLNPPQLGSLSFDITDRATGDKVTQFEPVYGSNTVMHTILLREDLEYFRHNTASLVVQGGISVPANFPTSGSYKAFAFYKPIGGETQEFQGRIVSGEETHGANLQERGQETKLVGAMRIDRIGASVPVAAGRSQQIAFLVSEKGQQVTSLGPVYSAPAHLWITDAEGERLWHAVGKSDSRRLIPEATSTAVVGSGAARTPTRSGPGSTPAREEGESPGGVLTETIPPTLVPELGAALATITAQPVSTLPPVQQTSLASVLESPAVPPVIGYGPTMIFEHTFPEPGLYKMWLEVQHRNEVVTSDWVIRVAP